MAILATSFRPKTYAPAAVQVKVVLPSKADEDLVMTDSSEHSSSEDSSGSEDAPVVRQHKQTHRTTAAAPGRRWFPGFGYFSRLTGVLSEPSASKSRKRKNSMSDDEEQPAKRVSRLY